ncbi:MAG: hypothetical protein FWC85_04125, partial [Elusimicrobia bacterium]|nr:hypothetical protein [Elusimicrobiota bacterium]
AGTYSMRYRARAVFEGGTGDRIKYSQWRMADVYQFVSDSDMVSNTLTLRRYHSRLQDSRASFPSGASLPTGITFTEIAPQNVPSGGIVGIRHYRISSDTVDISNIPINLILSHGHIEPAADYEIRVLGHDGVWVSLGGVNDNVDRTVRLNGFTGQSLNAAAAQAVAQGRLRGAGINALSSNENDWYFGIFRSAPTTDGSFRPDNRIAIVGRTSIRFGTDENQHNIQRVRIFNTNGRQVAELRQAPFIWDGRNVPSGTYVYQIRANGRTISGTVAVAR